MASALYLSERLLHRSQTMWQPALMHKMQHSLPAVQCLNRIVCVRKQTTAMSKHDDKPAGQSVTINLSFQKVPPAAEESEDLSHLIQFARNHKSAIRIAIGLTIGVGWFIFNAIPHGVKRRAFKRCKNDPKVLAALGEPVENCAKPSERFGDKTINKTLNYDSHEYRNISDGKIHMRMRFYIQGPYGKGTVNLEMVEKTWIWFDYVSLSVQLDKFPNSPIVLVDNR